ncbi:kinesin light chain [Pyrenophora seminiperda CCB06]|uniref:Kinesin light chain n=1 Tax=Pyrenophora seminiperda CCB06 TaxID=1302712 RepID=A0A3M7LXQ4_9PLEO|nr:kinesin light chain [Pyrenophora seminiperda CCB06]
MASTISFGDANAGFQAGIVNGPTPLQERRETPPLPDIAIPFARDADFVERGTTLERVDRICAAPNSRAALVGLGGVGKSQLAIEYAYRTHERSPETWVFWVHASNAARFEQSYRDMADRAKIAGRRDPQANIFKLVHDWLCNCKQGWLLVLDNVDDARFLFDVLASGNGQGQGQINNTQIIRKPLREYLPHCERGSILVTTRNREAALKLVERCDIIRVEPMDEEEGVALFRKKLEAQADNSDIAKLAAVLEYMPLAIVQAAAYISQRAPLCSVAKYLEEFRKSERRRLRLLGHDDGQLRRDWQAKSAITVTWQISFEYIQQTQPGAADLLSLMSFFDRQGIPTALLQPHAERGEAQTNQREADDGSDDESEDDASQSSAGDDKFRDAVAVLRNFCFISVNTTGTSFEMHALVQLATRKWLEDNSMLEQWKQQFVSNLHAAFPTGEYENWTACRALYAHAKAAAGQQPKDESSIAEWATVLYRAAWYACMKGNIADAQTLSVKSMKARNRLLGRENADAVWSIAMVGLAYKLGGRWDDAEKLEVEVMEIRKTKLGADHPATLASIVSLALTYRNQGRWDDAEKLEVELFVQAMEMSRKELGVDHPSTLISTGSLASIYKTRGRWDDAEKLFVQTKLGADHPDTLTSMLNLASTYWNQGRWDNAERLFVQVMETRKTKLGADHPSTLTSMLNLVLMYRHCWRWNDAEDLLAQVVEIFKTKLGADHPSTLTSIGSLASIYKNQGRWDDAEKLQAQVTEMSKTKLGADHPDTLTSMANLAFTWKAQGRNSKAIVLMRQCVQQRQRVLKAGHPDLESCLTVLEQWEAEYHAKPEIGIRPWRRVDFMDFIMRLSLVGERPISRRHHASRRPSMCSESTIEDSEFITDPKLAAGALDESQDATTTESRSTSQPGTAPRLNCNDDVHVGQKDDESTGSLRAVLKDRNT